MNKTFLSIGLFFGVFAAAYAGFFYQKYTTSQEPTEITALTNTPVHMYSGSTLNNNLTSTKISASGAIYQNTKTSDTKSQTTSHTVKNQQQKRNTLERSTDSLDQPEIRRHGQSNDALAKAQRTSSYNLSGFSRTILTNNNALQPSSAPTFNNISTTTDENPEISSRQITTTNTSNTTSDNSANNTTNSLNNNISDVATPETDQLATPNCPVQLPGGSTKADADSMRQTYGCRYLKYCQNINDGKNGYKCWWGFYSS